MTATHQASAPAEPRYPAKRAAIAQAALRRFVRDGYERTTVDAIAAEAGVSKRTVYNHYSDKEQLFLAVIEDTYQALLDQVQEITERALGAPGDTPQRLQRVVGGIARELSRSPERAALLRLILTEAPHFPALRERWQGRRSILPLLARVLAELPPDSGLDLPDPALAAEHLSALTLGQINNRSLFGLRDLTDDQIDELIAGGLAAFLRAYRRD